MCGHVGVESGSDVVSQDLHGVGPAKDLLRTRHHLVFGWVLYRRGQLRGDCQRHSWQCRRCCMQVRKHFYEIVVFIDIYLFHCILSFLSIHISRVVSGT